jgi:hypothetical protein
VGDACWRLPSTTLGLRLKQDPNVGLATAFMANGRTDLSTESRHQCGSTNGGSWSGCLAMQVHTPHPDPGMAARKSRAHFIRRAELKACASSYRTHLTIICRRGTWPPCRPFASGPERDEVAGLAGIFTLPHQHMRGTSRHGGAFRCLTLSLDYTRRADYLTE